MKPTLTIIRSGGKAFVGIEPYTLDGVCHLDGVCEMVSLMSARGGGLAKQVILTGIDYSSKPLNRMVFTDYESKYTTHDMPEERERNSLLDDYERFCSQDRKIVEPPAPGIVTAK